MTLAPGLPDPVHDAAFYEGVAARRLVAFLIDAAAIAALSLAAILLFGVLTLGFGFLAAAPAAFAVSFVYRAATLAGWSATPGMALVGIELRRFDGKPFGPFEAVGHTALFLLMFALVAPQIVSIATMALGTPGRALHDLPFGSAAINRPA
jgi:uncharacterized RDD family membrane protein YckC